MVVAKCKYCGRESQYKDMCGVCREKYPLVRKLVKMCEPYRTEKPRNNFARTVRTNEV